MTFRQFQGEESVCDDIYCTQEQWLLNVKDGNSIDSYCKISTILILICHTFFVPQTIMGQNHEGSTVLLELIFDTFLQMFPG